MKYHEYIVALVFAAGIALGFFTAYHPEDKRSLKQTQAEVHHLKQHIDSLADVNQRLDATYLELQHHTDSLQKELQNSRNHYTQLKQHKHEAITHITRLNTNGLFEFFSNINLINAKDSTGK